MYNYLTKPPTCTIYIYKFFYKLLLTIVWLPTTCMTGIKRYLSSNQESSYIFFLQIRNQEILSFFKSGIRRYYLSSNQESGDINFFLPIRNQQILCFFKSGIKRYYLSLNQIVILILKEPRLSHLIIALSFNSYLGICLCQGQFAVKK